MSGRKKKMERDPRQSVAAGIDASEIAVLPFDFTAVKLVLLFDHVWLKSIKFILLTSFR